MGVNRDLKKATEAYWGGKLSQADLLTEAKRLRLEHWTIQKNAGVDVIPSNDFALYDQVLTHIQDFGVSSLCLLQCTLRTSIANLNTGCSRQIYDGWPRPCR
jgi:Cobalamin-independent synthase, N-terminal domain